MDFFNKNISPKIVIPLLIVVLGLVGYISYGYVRETTLLSHVSEDLNTTKSNFQQKISLLEKNVADLQKQGDTISKTVTSEQEKTGSINTLVNQITSNVGLISNSVNTLQKLSQTDSELLKKYSKVYFLNEHYVPLSLATIDSKYVYDKNKVLQFHATAYSHLQNLLDTATANGYVLEIDSSYRSFGTQAVLKSNYRVTYGAGTANSFSAEQGYSEHQLGTAVDFTTTALKGGLSGFDKTPEYAWLMANGYRYGFVISYPQNNGYYVFEPWHWRFVGVALATKIHNDNTFFYAVDQRIIDSFLANIFD